MSQDNALKRALIPFIKLLTNTINGYTQWAVEHRSASNALMGGIVGVVSVLWLISIIAFMMTPAGLMIFKILCLLLVVYSIKVIVGEMING